MGILRLLFAFSIVIYHAGQFFGYNIANSTIAVLSFFVISGFYMALILDKKYTQKKKHLYLFWSNRFLRIFPLYWITLLVIIILTLGKFVFHLGADNAIIHYLNWSPHTSAFVFGFNLFNYILRNLTLIVSVDYFRINDSTPGYLLVQQAWTLQYELLFYLLAPFLMQFSKKIFFGFFCVYIISFFGILLPMHLMQNTLLFGFLNNLVYFLLGIVSYRYVYLSLQSKKVSLRLATYVFVTYLFYLLFYNFLPLRNFFTFSNGVDPLYLFILVLSLPFIFMLTKSSSIDSFIGKFSYPVYIFHFIIIKLFSNGPLFTHDSNLKTILVMITSLFVAFLAIKYIEIPVDTFRQKRLGKVQNAHK